MKVQEMNIDKIIPYVQNPKAHPEGQIKKLAGAIAEFKWDQPIVVDKDMVIIKGHGRLMAAQALGIKTVPVVIADYLTPAQVKAARIADNKVAESEWFPETLALELKALEEMDFDLGLTGFDKDELEAILTDSYGDTSTDRDGQGVTSTWDQVKSKTATNKITVGDMEIKIDNVIMQSLTDYLSLQFDKGVSYSESTEAMIVKGIKE